VAKKRKTVDVDKILRSVETPWYARRSTITVLIGLIALTAIVYFFMQPAGVGKAVETGESDFIAKANQCAPAVTEVEINTATMRIESHDDCSITKTVIAMDETEPEEIRDLFVGSEMTCTYDRGAFDSDYVTQISGNLGYCEGSLVRAILAVI